MNASALPPPLPPLPLPARSSFVGVLAWISLCLCAFGLLVLVVEVLGFRAFSHSAAYAALHQQLMAKPDIAALLTTLSRWVPGLLVVSVAQCLLGVIGAIGLMKRHEWARRLFVGLLAFSAVWQCAAVAMQWWLMNAIGTLVQALPRAATEQGAQMQAQIAASLTSSHLTGAVFGLAFAGLYAWLAWILCTPRIRAEFAAPRAAREVVSL